MLPLDLTWEAPAECPDAPFVVRRVEQIIVSESAPTPVSARARVRRTDAGRYELALTLRSGELEDTRTVDAASCTALADATAVVIALALTPEPTSDVPPPVDAKARDKARTTPAPPTRPPGRSEPPLLVALGGVFEPGPLPSPGGGLELLAGLRVARARVVLRGAAWLPQDAVFDPRTGAGATFTMVQLGASGAYVLPLPRPAALHDLGVGPSLGVDADLVRVAAFGIRDPRTAWTSWPTVALGARGELGFTRWLGLVARAELVLAPDAPTFTLSTAGSQISLHDPAGIYPRLGLAVEIRLP